MLLPLSRHAANLVSVLGESEYVAEWASTAEWLQLAASVKSVEIDIIQHDPAFGYCSTADQYNLSREDLLKQFATKIAVFSFVWGALESSLKVIDPPNHPARDKRGKIRNACYLLDNYFARRQLVSHLLEETANFRSLAQNCFGYDNVEKRFLAASSIKPPSIGLFGVYELRNSFAHGSLAFPEPDEDNLPVSSHGAMIEHAARVVLISIQMLLLAHFNDSDDPISFALYPDSLAEEYPLSSVLRGCHMELQRSEDQMSFEFR